MSTELVQIFKSLADPVRLRLIALIVEDERCGQELAAELSLAPATVSHHLRRLREAGLLRERAAPPYVYYRLDHAALRRAVLSVTDKKRVSKLATAGLAADKRKVLETFFDGDRLTAIPAQRRKKEIVFEEILRRIPRRDIYAERELSDFIAEIHDDFCTIRRELIMGKYMERDRGRYRLAPRGRAVVGE
jgi:DNA-binding HxlR family transcriptional regulator